mmetsp:Transcript_45316/g.33091  ORF Transcript_45316/g.33091 Transcript_45316/m.33091 type:complete len:110 (+) Transcript_45316:396-725(+)
MPMKVPSAEELAKELFNDLTLVGMLDPTLLNAAKNNKELFHFESEVVAGYIDFLDTICPKDIYQCGVLLVPKYQRLPIASLGELAGKEIPEKWISENHVRFLACLGITG